MRNLLVVLLVGTLSAHAHDTALGQKVSLKMERANLKQVIEAVERQTNLGFLYNEEEVNTVADISVSMSERDVRDVLDFVLRGTNLTYSIARETILISTRSSQPPRGVTIGGLIADENGTPLPGGLVQIKGTTTGAVADASGRYEITVPAELNMVLVYTFLGMQTVEITYIGQSEINVTMRTADNLIDGVVITGYTQTVLTKTSGSVGVLDAEVFENKALPTIDAILQGELPGVAVTTVSGQPGRSMDITIRGQNTISGQMHQPLWVVDGVPLQGNMPNITDTQWATGGFEDLFVNGIGNINPNDIENVTVLKDAAAAAIYGSRAANGVIVVTTKKGKAGQAMVSYGGNVSITLAPQRDNNLMNSAEKLAWEDELWNEFAAQRYTDGRIYPTVGIVGMIRSGYGQYAGLAGNKAAQDAEIARRAAINTDWFGELFRNSVQTNHNLSVRGGSDTFVYYVSGGYTYTDGLLKRDNYNRSNLMANLGYTPNPWMKFNLKFDVAQQTSKAPNLGVVNPFQYAYFANPYESPYNDDGSYRPDETYHNLGVLNGANPMLYDAGFNVMREIDETSSETRNWTNDITFDGTFRIFENLTFNGLIGYTFSNNKTEKINQKDTYAAWSDRLPQDRNNSSLVRYGSITQNSANLTSYIARGHFAFNDMFCRDHAVSAIAGAEIRGAESKTIFLKRYNYDPLTGTTSLPPRIGDETSYQAALNALSGDYFTQERYASFYVSADYLFRDKYVVNLTLRTDGSSYFGSERQFNPTWSAGVAWHIARESFMAPLSGWLNDLSLRVATGFTGNVNNSASPYLIMNYGSQKYRVYDDVSYPIGTIYNAPNPQLRWEKTHDYKVALSFGLLDSRIEGAVEAYWGKSTDVVNESAIPYTTGFRTQNVNSVDISNKGIEATLSGKIVARGPFRLSASVNFAYNGNRVTRYTQDYNYIDRSSNYWEGYPTYSIFVGKLLGVDPYEGLYEFQLREDAIVNTSTDLANQANYYYYLGTANAPYTGGFRLKATYGNFGLSVLGSYSLGSKTFDKIVSPADSNDASRNGVIRTNPQSQYSDLYSNHLNVRKDRTDRWTAENPSGAKYPRIYDAWGDFYDFARYYPMGSSVVDGIYLKDNSYLRIREILFSYDVPAEVSRRAGMSRVALNMSLNNFFTFTGYDGMDPETPGAVYPVSRSVTFGVSISF